MAAVGERLGEDDELAVDPLAELQRDVADRLEGRPAVAAGDLLHGHGAVRAPAADAEDLVQPVRDELVADAGRVVAAAGDAALRALDAVLGERRGERGVDLLLLLVASWSMLLGRAAPGNDERPRGSSTRARHLVELTGLRGASGGRSERRRCRSAGSTGTRHAARRGSPGPSCDIGSPCEPPAYGPSSASAHDGHGLRPHRPPCEMKGRAPHGRRAPLDYRAFFATAPSRSSRR